MAGAAVTRCVRLALCCMLWGVAAAGPHLLHIEYPASFEYPASLEHPVSLEHPFSSLEDVYVASAAMPLHGAPVHAVALLDSLEVEEPWDLSLEVPDRSDELERMAIGVLGGHQVLLPQGGHGRPIAPPVGGLGGLGGPVDALPQPGAYQRPHHSG